MSRKGSENRAAFTLVEVLVVTVIISILLALVSAAIYGAFEAGKEAAINAEAQKIGLAFEANYQDPPPADLRNPQSSSSLIYKYVSRRFERYDITRLKTDLDNEEIAYANFDPGYALMFWLVGFSPDSSNPFRGHEQRMSGQDLGNALYDFDWDRVVDGHYFPDLPAYYLDADDDGVWDPGSGYANGAWGTPSVETYDRQLAFLYFDYKTYAVAFDPDGGGSLPSFYAYQKTAAGAHYNRNGYQIISAGLDRLLGIGGNPRDLAGANADGEPFIGDDADNLANFSNGKLGDYTDQ